MNDPETTMLETGSATPSEPAPGWALRRCVGDVDEFVREHWARRPWVHRSGASFKDLLDVDSIERMLTGLGRRPTFRVIKADGSIIPTSYTMSTRVGGVRIDDVADVERILELVAGGATVVLQALQRTWAPLTSFCHDLEVSASHPVQANAYLSPPNAAGLRAHEDTHGVFALQVSGTKRWNVAGEGELQLGPGDVLYLPAGTRHEAWTADAFSLHVTVGVLATTRRQVLHRIVDRLDAELDRPLPFGYAHPDRTGVLVDDLTDLVTTIRDRLTDVDPHEEADRQRQRSNRLRRRRPERLAAIVDPQVVHDGVTLRRLTEAAVTDARDGNDADAAHERVALEFSDQRLLFPAAATPALDIVATRPTFRLDELVGLDPTSRAVIARRLIREGLLQIVVTDR